MTEARTPAVDAGDLIRSPLHDRHVALGAKMGEFGGWTMPLEYAGGGVIAEHNAVRENVGIFDVSHLGKASVRGPGRRRLHRRHPDQRPVADQLWLPSTRMAPAARSTRCVPTMSPVA